MTAPRGDAPGGAGARGLVVILLAIGVGVFLLRNATDDPLSASTPVTTASSDADQADGGDGGDSGDDGQSDGGDQTTSSLDITPVESDDNGDGSADDPDLGIPVDTRQPAEVRVQVANGARVSGVAGSTTTRLAALGYVTLTATNLNPGETLATTRVHHVDGFLAEAQAVATALGAPLSAVSAMPTDRNIQQDDGADVLVVLGTDLANAAAS